MEFDVVPRGPPRWDGGTEPDARPLRGPRRPLAGAWRLLRVGAPLAVAGCLTAAPGGAWRGPAAPRSASAALPAAQVSEAPPTGLQILPGVEGSANDPAVPLPPAPPGVDDLRLNEIFRRPFGARGLEFTAKARALDGKRVRIAGYMVKDCQPPPARFLLAAVPVALHVREMGPCDDLPAETVLVTLRHATPEAAVSCVLPHTPSLVVATGTLRLGGSTAREGPVPTWIRLEVDFVPPAPPPPTTAPRSTAPRPSPPTSR